MSRLRKQIKTLIKNSDSTPSLFYWTQILTFFEDHTDELDIKEVRMLCAECERCRTYWNTEEVTETKFIKPGGQEQTLTRVRQSLHIEQEDVNPNIYAHLAEMERQEEEKKPAVEEQVPATATA